jgi:hypothetical protein
MVQPPKRRSEISSKCSSATSLWRASCWMWPNRSLTCHAAAFDGLQEDAAAVAEDAGDARGRVVLARLRQDALDGFGAGVDGAAA